MNYAFGYIRTSKGDSDQHWSPEAQREAIRKHFHEVLAPLGIRWGDYYTDIDVSATRFTDFDKRPAANRLTQITRRGDHIIFAKLDRAFRTVPEGLLRAQQWRESGVVVHFLDLRVDTSTAMGEAFLTFALMGARLEARKTGERTKAALAVKRSKGLPSTRYEPWGWRKVGSKRDSRYVPCLRDRQFAAWLLRLRRAGRSEEEIVLYCARIGLRYERPYVFCVWRTDPPDVITRAFVRRCLRAVRSGFPLPNGETLPIEREDEALDIEGLLAQSAK